MNPGPAKAAGIVGTRISPFGMQKFGLIYQFFQAFGSSQDRRSLAL
jgi:hypothetical protein